MPKVYFDERIAARYETYWPELFQPEAIDGRMISLISIDAILPPAEQAAA